MEPPDTPVHPAIQHAFDAYLAAASLTRRAAAAPDEGERQILLIQAEAARIAGETALRHIGPAPV